MGNFINFLSNNLGYILYFIYNITKNYGISIVIFTIILKLILLPLEIKQRITNQKVMKISEKQRALAEKYKKDQAKYNSEILKLYKKENLSVFAPFLGMLLTILQIFIILSVFYMVSKPLTHIKRMPQNEIDTYIAKTEEISNNQNSNNRRNDFQKEIKVLQTIENDDKLKLNMNFLGIDLRDTPGEKVKSLNDIKNIGNIKVMIIPILYILISVINLTVARKDLEKQRETAKNENKDLNTAKDEKAEDKFTQDDFQDAMMSSQKIMTYIMPIMMFSVTMITPLAVALYWLINTITEIFKIKVVKKIVDKKLEEEKTK
ncbi:MAG: membrane protein insertase YidC [Clostridium sp.]